MLVNRLGKRLVDDGINFSNFLCDNNIQLPYDTFYSWCTLPRTPQKKNYIYVEQISNVLGETFNETLNMIASKGDIEVSALPILTDDNNLLKLARVASNLTAKALADRVGVSYRDIYSLERGEIPSSFSDGTALEVYLSILRMDIREFNREFNRLRDAYREEKRERYATYRATCKEEPVVEEGEVYEIIPVDSEESPYTTTVIDPIEDALRYLYGKVDCEVFLTVSKILKGE